MTTTAPTPTQELEALLALVGRLSKVSLEATRLTVDIQTRLPAVVALSSDAAAAAATAAALTAHTTAITAAAAACNFVRRTPKTPAELTAAFPEGSGEVWYVVLIGREPGLYRTSTEADKLCNGVPGQEKAKKKSLREALAWYRDAYNAPGGDGVQKWVEASADE
ncbi:hypothetical protein C8R43DRAFT_964418 [Mycena crocata]|nr:hypothetical protein C8R43DRAFT_964418 [Mycena crocata]